LNNYSLVDEASFVLDKNFAENFENALKINDVIVTLAQCSEIVHQDIERKVSDHISKQNKPLK